MSTLFGDAGLIRELKKECSAADLEDPKLEKTYTIRVYFEVYSNDWEDYSESLDKDDRTISVTEYTEDGAIDKATEIFINEFDSVEFDLEDVFNIDDVEVTECEIISVKLATCDNRDTCTLDMFKQYNDKDTKN